MWSYNYGYLCHGMNDYLEHHGILGQKWGIRRFQNPDGSLTPAGKKRYRTSSDSVYDISSPKGISRRLNDLDKSMALNSGTSRTQGYLKNVEGPNSDKHYKKWKEANQNFLEGQFEKGYFKKKAEDEGMVVRENVIPRFTDKGGKALAKLAFGVVTTTPGTHYKVSEGYKITDEDMNNLKKLKKEAEKLEKRELRAENNPKLTVEEFRKIYNEWQDADDKVTEYAAKLTNKKYNRRPKDEDDTYNWKDEQWVEDYKKILSKVYE